jgi:Ca2+-binding EF-hand superfamily protein
MNTGMFEKKEIQEMFKEYDEDGNDSLTEEEFIKFIDSTGMEWS